MSVTRLVVAGAALAVGTVRVPAETAHHARVARVMPGDPVEVLDLAGTVGIVTLARWDGGTCVVEVERVEYGRGEPPAPLVLGLVAGVAGIVAAWLIVVAILVGACALALGLRQPESAPNVAEVLAA